MAVDYMTGTLIETEQEDDNQQYRSEKKENNHWFRCDLVRLGRQSLYELLVLQDIACLSN